MGVNLANMLRGFSLLMDARKIICLIREFDALTSHKQNAVRLDYDLYFQLFFTYGVISCWHSTILTNYFLSGAINMWIILHLALYL